MQYESTTVNNSTSDDDEQTPMQLSSSAPTTALCCELDNDTHKCLKIFTNDNLNNNYTSNAANNCSFNNHNVCNNNASLMSLQSVQFQNETQFVNKTNGIFFYLILFSFFIKCVAFNSFLIFIIFFVVCAENNYKK